MFELDIDPLAIEDVDVAAARYAFRSKRAAQRFLKEIEEKFESITIHPFQYHIYYGSIHKAHLRKFPYSLYFHVIHDRIRVIACLHNSRNKESIIEERN